MTLLCSCESICRESVRYYRIPVKKPTLTCILNFFHSLQGTSKRLFTTLSRHEKIYKIWCYIHNGFIVSSDVNCDPPAATD